MIETNWAGNHRYRADTIEHPATIEALARIILSAEHVRPLGSRHSFNDIADAPVLVSLEQLDKTIEVCADRTAVRVSGHATYAEVAARLGAEGLALHNMASLPHISIAGAVATGTHGSGDANGNLATAVTGLELVTADGAIVAVSKGDENFDGMVVGLGALGVVTHLTLAVEPSFEVQQFVFEGLRWERLEESFGAVFAGGYSVSVFTRWSESAAEQVWVKCRGGDNQMAERFFGAKAATVDRHPILEMPADACTAQLGVVGRWADRLPHFRAGFTPSAGAEIQSEFFVARDDAVGAMAAIRGIAHEIEPVLLVSEIRTIAADGLWMSPHYGRASTALHFTWRQEPVAVHRAVARVEEALAPFSARPHWGKVFTAFDSEGVDRLPDFLRLVDRLDPEGKFRNRWFDEWFTAP